MYAVMLVTQSIWPRAIVLLQNRAAHVVSPWVNVMHLYVATPKSGWVYHHKMYMIVCVWLCALKVASVSLVRSMKSVCHANLYGLGLFYITL